jgi:hypothetical protein
MTASKFSRVRLCDGVVLDGFQIVDTDDLKSEASEVHPGEKRVSLSELSELTGRRRSTIDRLIAKLGGQPRSDGSSHVKSVSADWVSAHADDIFGRGHKPTGKQSRSAA